MGGYLFAYGSLMEPASLALTLPGIDLDACVPAECEGFVRSFEVAFPNDGSEPDKAYFSADGGRPGVVLFCHLRPEPRAGAYGVCVPVNRACLAALRRRELRYQLVGLGSRVRPLADAGRAGLPSTVSAFVGRRRFTSPGPVARGVVAADYLAGIRRGAAHWETRSPGFLAGFEASTVLPAADRVVQLTRSDHPAL